MKHQKPTDGTSPESSVPPEEQGGKIKGRPIPTRRGIQFVDLSGIEDGKYYEGDCLKLMGKFPMGVFDTILMHPTYISRAHDLGYAGNKRKPFDVHKILPEDRYWSRELLREYPEVHRICVLLRDLYREDMMLWAVWLAWRILEARRVLSKSGYLWICCPEGADHGIRLLLTSIFGNTSFQEILWLCSRVDGQVHQIIGVKNDPSEITVSEPVFTREVLSKQEIPLSEWDLKNSQYHDLPTALMKYILQKQPSAGRRVLEAFGGDGTFCRAAHDLGDHWLYAELDRKVSKEFIKNFAEPKGGRKFPKTVPTGDLQSGREKIDDLIKAAMYLSQVGLCARCKQEISFRKMTFDHKFPRSKGGPDVPRNLRLLCKDCNQILEDSNWE